MIQLHHHEMKQVLASPSASLVGEPLSLLPFQGKALQNP